MLLGSFFMFSIFLNRFTQQKLVLHIAIQILDTTKPKETLRENSEGDLYIVSNKFY